MKIHVRLVALSEIGDGILRPLIRLGQEHAARELLIHVRPQLSQVSVRFRQVFAVGFFALI